jgi:hypothetical protein
VSVTRRLPTRELAIDSLFSNRLDLVEKFARKNPSARFVMAGADNTFVLQAVVDGANAAKTVAQSLLV